MNRNQLIVIAACVLLGAGLYLFTDIKKHKEPSAKESSESTPAQPAAGEVLDIEEYVAETGSRIEDKATREKVEQLTATNAYKDLLAEYQKLDKPLAVAYYSVKLAEKENNPELYVNAGDFNAMLLPTAPDTKAKNYLSGNITACYQKAVELAPENTDYKIRLAGAYMENGSAPMQGVTILLDIVKKDSTNIDALLMLGRFGIISGQYDKAIGRLEKILYLQPQNSEALFLLAEAYNQQGNKNKAIEMLERCKKTVADPEAKREIDGYIESIKKPKS